jgi:hypothetical protein
LTTYPCQCKEEQRGYSSHLGLRQLAVPTALGGCVSFAMEQHYMSGAIAGIGKGRRETDIVGRRCHWSFRDLMAGNSHCVQDAQRKGWGSTLAAREGLHGKSHLLIIGGAVTPSALPELHRTGSSTGPYSFTVKYQPMAKSAIINHWDQSKLE